MKQLIILLIIISSCNRETAKERTYRQYIVQQNSRYEKLSKKFDTLYAESMEIVKIALEECKYIDSLKRQAAKERLESQ
jgi:hypothetical protein